MSTHQRPASPTLRGDEQELFKRHADQLQRSVAKAVSAPAHVVEEACAFAWFQLVRTQPDRDNAPAWLHVVATREAIRLAKQQKRHASLDDAGEAATAFELGLPNLPSKQCAVEDQVHLGEVLSELRQMPERRQRIFLAHLCGLSYEEIADMTGATIRTVQRQILKARTTLRQQFA